MLKGKRQDADSRKTEFAPKRHGSHVTASNKIELHGTIAKPFRKRLRMQAHFSRHSPSSRFIGNHITAVAHVAARARIICLNVVAAYNSTLNFSNESCARLF